MLSSGAVKDSPSLVTDCPSPSGVLQDIRKRGTSSYKLYYCTWKISLSLLNMVGESGIVKG